MLAMDNRRTTKQAGEGVCRRGLWLGIPRSSKIFVRHNHVLVIIEHF